MDFDILDSLEELAYPGALTDDSGKEIIHDGLKSVEFCNLVAWLSKELQELCQLESCINTISDLEDKSSFIVEVNTFLRELECPYDSLTNGPISEILLEEKKCAILLGYLCTELIGARIAMTKKLKKKQALDIEMDSSPAAACMSSILKILNITLNSTCDSSQLFEAISNKIEEKISNHPEIVGKPLLSVELTDSHWDDLEKIHANMLEEYKLRREMLLTRFDVVAQSFKWGENIKGKEELIVKAWQPARMEMKSFPEVELADVLVAREDLTIIEKASCASVRENTVCELNRVVIDRVPDRGGRPNEQRPPVEMPDWKKRTQSQDAGHFRKRGGYRGGGGSGGSGKNKGRGFHRSPKNTSQSRDSRVFDAMGSYGSN